MYTTTSSCDQIGFECGQGLIIEIVNFCSFLLTKAHLPIFRILSIHMLRFWKTGNKCLFNLFLDIDNGLVFYRADDKKTTW